MDVREKIIEILSHYGDMMEGDFRDNGINSIEFIKIVVDLEEELNIEVDDGMLDVDKISSLDALCEVLERLVEEKKVK